jgi:hypothetical protein
VARSANLVTIGSGRLPLHCLICRGQLFTSREIKLNTSGMEFLGMEWANRSGTALICDRCSFVHTFADSALEEWDPQGGYPATQES